MNDMKFEDWWVATWSEYVERKYQGQDLEDFKEIAKEAWNSSRIYAAKELLNSTD